MRCKSCNSDYVSVSPMIKKVGNKLLKAKYECLNCKHTWFEVEKMKIVCTGEKPSYINECAAGLDLRANEDVMIYPNTMAIKIKRLVNKILGKRETLPHIVDIKSLLAVELPPGLVGLLVARSGLSFKYQIKLINDIGIIDEDYRGDIGIRLINEGKKPYLIKNGDRVAQLVIVPYIQPQLVYVDELSKTQRGKGGFGHTGR